MSKSGIVTVPILFHFVTFHNFKHFYLFYTGEHLKKDFTEQLSYNRFVEIQYKVFIPVMFFLNPVRFGKRTGITFTDSAKIAVRN